MFLGIISSSSLPIITSHGVPQFGNIAVIELIVLLILKEFFFVSERWDEEVRDSLNLPIMSLGFVFIGVLLFKIKSLILMT